MNKRRAVCYIVIYSLIILILSTFISVFLLKNMTIHQITNQLNLNNSKRITKDIAKNIRFNTVSSQFIDYSTDNNSIRKETPSEIMVFDDEEKWNSFKNIYLKGIQVPDLDFFTKKFILLNITPAKQNYAILDNVISINLSGKDLNIITDSTGIVKKSTNNVYYKSFNLIAIDKDLLTDDIKINILSANNLP